MYLRLTRGEAVTVRCFLSSHNYLNRCQRAGWKEHKKSCVPLIDQSKEVPRTHEEMVKDWSFWTGSLRPTLKHPPCCTCQKYPLPRAVPNPQPLIPGPATSPPPALATLYCRVASHSR